MYRSPIVEWRKKVKKVACLIALALLVPSASANNTQASAAANPDCTWESVGAKWKVNPYILYSIAKTESGLNPRAINRANANGSEDVGMMQINSFWFPKLAKYGITRESLFNACVSLDVAGWILSQNMARHGNTWTAIGAYNAVTPSKRVVYARKILKNLPAEALNEHNSSD